MTARVARGTFDRSCATCGWTGTYATAGLGDAALRRHSCRRNEEVAARQARGAARLAGVDRTPKPCLHKRANHQHGDYAAYRLDGCRCIPCSAAVSEYNSNAARQKAYGRWDQWVTPARARAHLKKLVAAGMGLRAIATTAGVPRSVLASLIHGKQRATGKRTPVKRIHRDTETAILAVTPQLAGGALIDANETISRLTRLIAAGWSKPVLAAKLEVAASNFNGLLTRTRVTVSTATKVQALYDVLAYVSPPQQTPNQTAAVERTKASAAARGWAPPPAKAAPTPNELAARAADIDQCIALGASLNQIATRHVMTPADLIDWCATHAPDLAITIRHLAA